MKGASKGERTAFLMGYAAALTMLGGRKDVLSHWVMEHAPGGASTISRLTDALLREKGAGWADPDIFDVILLTSAPPKTPPPSSGMEVA